MANLTPQEYISNLFGNEDTTIIRAVRVDSQNSNYKNTAQVIQCLLKKDNKTAATIKIYANKYEEDGITIAKDGGKYFRFDSTGYPSLYDMSRSEMKALLTDGEKQLDMIKQKLSKGWAITQDPWDTNVVPKSLSEEAAAKQNINLKYKSTKKESPSGVPLEIEVDIFADGMLFTTATAFNKTEPGNAGGYYTKAKCGFEFDQATKTLSIPIQKFIDSIGYIRINSDYAKSKNISDPTALDKIGDGKEYLIRLPIETKAEIVGYTSSPSQDPAGMSQSNETIPKPEPVEKIAGDFTFNVEKESLFINSQLGTFSIISIGDMTGEIMNEELLDDEYSEREYDGVEEMDPEFSAIPHFSALDMINSADAERDTTESGKVYQSSGQVLTGTLNTTPDTGKGFGIIGKTTSEKDLLKIMVDYVEGGYYYPAHAAKFNAKSRQLYGASGETLWGIDRCAGQTETSELGRKFWAAVDAVSGYGDKSGKNGYSKSTKTGAWDNSKYGVIDGAWKYNYMPTEKDKGYSIMLDSFTKYATSHMQEWLDKYFKDHPVKSLILSDGRMKFMWLRATWNGPGWFSWYANGKNKKKGLKWAYDNVSTNVDDLIIWDLNNRLLYNSALITHDVKKISKLIGIKNSVS